MFQWLRKLLSLVNFLENLKRKPVLHEITGEDLESIQHLFQSHACLRKMYDNFSYDSVDLAIRASFRADKHPHWSAGYAAGYAMCVHNLKQFFVKEDMSALLDVNNQAQHSPEGVKFTWKR